MMVPKAILVLSGVLCDHVPALPLQQKGEETAHDSQTSGHLESSTLPIPDPPFFFFLNRRTCFCRYFLFGLCVGGRVILLTSQPTEGLLLGAGGGRRWSKIPFFPPCFASGMVERNL